MTTASVHEIIELHFCGVFSEEFDVYLIPAPGQGNMESPIMVYEKKHREQTNIVRDTYMRPVKWTKEGLVLR